MIPEQEKLLKETLELSRENNKILKKMKRSMMWSRLFKLAYLVIILGATFGAYYFVQPYLEGVLGSYQSLLGGPEKAQQVGNSLPDIFDALPGLGN